MLISTWETASAYSHRFRAALKPDVPEGLSEICARAGRALVTAYERAGDLDKAISAAGEEVARSPESSSAHSRLAGLLERADRTDEAIKAYEAAAKCADGTSRAN